MYDQQRSAWDRLYRLRGQTWSRNHEAWFPVDEDWLLLDLGCGTGKSCELMSCKVVAADFSMTALKLTRSNHPRIHPVCCDIAALPFRDGSFDLVRASFVLGHLIEETRAIAISEAGRVLKPDGMVVIELFSGADGRCQGSPRDDEASFRERDGIYHRSFEIEEVEEMLAGFYVLSIEECRWRQRVGPREFMPRCSIRSLAKKRPS